MLWGDRPAGLLDLLLGAAKLLVTSAKSEAGQAPGGDLHLELGFREASALLFMVQGVEP